MSTTAGRDGLEERIARLERRLGDAILATDRRDDSVEDRLNALERMLRVSAAPASARLPRAPVVAPTREARSRPHASAAARDRRMRAEDLGLVPGHFAPTLEDAPDISAGTDAHPTGTAAAPLSDLVGGRVLAWLGGATTLLGIILFLGLAISRGWIDEPGRVMLAALASAALMVAGVWLHDRRGRTEAAITLVGVGTAAAFATLIVGAEVYGLIPPMLAVIGSLVVGATATGLAIRWAGRAIGAIGLLGALASPVLVGADLDGGTVATLAVAASCAMWVATRQGWRWLGLAAVAVCAPQWGIWLLHGQPVGLELTALVAFTAIGLGGAIGAELIEREERLRASTTAIVVLNACVAGLVGYLALREASGAALGEAWLAALAAVHAGAGLWRRVRVSHALRGLLLTLAVVLADVAFALSATGIVLAAGWAISAVAFAWLGRRAADGERADANLLSLGMGAHLGLVLMRALLDAPPNQLGSGDAALLPLLSVSLLIASSFACARLTDARFAGPRFALDGLGMLALAYLTASVVDGPALVATWAFEGLALHAIARRSEEPAAICGALLFYAGAVAHALIAEAVPSGLVLGAADLGATAIALSAVGLVALVAGLREVDVVVRRWLLGAGAVTGIYLASIAIVTAFQPAAGVVNDTVLDLGVRQQGQVLLSVLWSAVGLGALVFALRRRITALRTGALALLLLSVAKVFLYDLSTLTSIYRVVSFVVLGLLLLAGAFAYQRLRPPPVTNDMRSVHPSQR